MDPYAQAGLDRLHAIRVTFSRQYNVDLKSLALVNPPLNNLSERAQVLAHEVLIVALLQLEQCVNSIWVNSVKPSLSSADYEHLKKHIYFPNLPATTPYNTTSIPGGRLLNHEEDTLVNHLNSVAGVYKVILDQIEPLRIFKHLGKVTNPYFSDRFRPSGSSAGSVSSGTTVSSVGMASTVMPDFVFRPKEFCKQVDEITAKIVKDLFSSYP